MNLPDSRQDDGTPRVFDAPYQTPDGTTVVPVSRPVGVFAIKDGVVTWAPATNATLVALAGILVGLVASTLAGIAMIRRPPWPDLHGDVSRRT